MTRILNPDTTAAILLGASNWTNAKLGIAPSFRRSASRIEKWLIDSRGLGLDPHRVIDLFDSQRSAGDQMAQISESLEELCGPAPPDGECVEDVIIFYVGHGSLSRSNELILLLRGTRAGIEDETGLRVADLARLLKVVLPRQRYYVVLDCCFSEAAAREFIGMGARDQAVAASAARDMAARLPRRGALLLCACSADEIAVGAPEAETTLFSGALTDILQRGDDQLPEEFSFRDLRTAVEDRLLEVAGPRAPRPVLHAINQKAGDLAELPAFSNKALAEQTLRRGEQPAAQDAGGDEVHGKSFSLIAPTLRPATSEGGYPERAGPEDKPIPDLDYQEQAPVGDAVDEPTLSEWKSVQPYFRWPRIAIVPAAAAALILAVISMTGPGPTDIKTEPVASDTTALPPLPENLQVAAAYAAPVKTTYDKGKWTLEVNSEGNCSIGTQGWLSSNGRFHATVYAGQTPMAYMNLRLDSELYAGPPRGKGNCTIFRPPAVRVAFGGRSSTPTAEIQDECHCPGDLCVETLGDSPTYEITEDRAPPAVALRQMLDASTVDVTVLDGPRANERITLSLDGLHEAIRACPASASLLDQ